MTELKFINRPGEQGGPEASTGCGCSPSFISVGSKPAGVCCPSPTVATGTGKAPAWIKGTIMTEAGAVPEISVNLTAEDFIGHARCRISAYRNSYTVPPGLYTAGSPDANSEVFVSANYKLSFDALRSSLKGINAWVLVLDTKGINVWCAAGKGTFSTEELVGRISSTQLPAVVRHRRVIVPQLGAPGISAHKVRQKSGFQVKYGPVRAADIPAYVAAGYKASREMREVKFPLIDRLILTPMEIRPALGYFLWYAAAVLLIFGLQPTGILFRDALTGGMPFLIFGLLSVFSGAFLTPLLLPAIPSSSFAVKGWIMGMLTLYPVERYSSLSVAGSPLLLVCVYLFFPVASSFIALQFTGSTTFTGMTGVRKELRLALPISISAAIISTALLTIHKLLQWGII